MRHARSVPGARDDAERGLTDAGRQQARDMAAWLAHQIGHVDAVICSSFMRAIETAEIMADALGTSIQRTPMLDPDAKPDEAWRHVEAIAGFSAEVLVVGHHPLIGHMIDQLGSVGGISHIFEHGAIALVDTYSKEMHWLVNPDLVARDEDLDDALAEAAEATAALLEVDAPELRGLKHPKHANVLGPIRSQAATALKRFFKRQGQLLLTQIKPRLREADDPNEKAADIIPSNLPIAITGGTSVDYSKALSNALAAGYEGLAGELGSDAELDEDIVQSYLTDHSLTKLTGDFEETTVERLRNALADAYEKGADFEGLVDAIKEEYAGFSDVRAGMIAQTEMSAAYNNGRRQLALDMGFNEKAVDPDGTACEELCVPAVLEGWIPIDDDFESGDAAPFHPNCDCGMNFRFNADAEE